MIDNEIKDIERKNVEDHLLQCAACQKELERLQILNSVGKAEIYDEPGSEYWKKLTSNIMNKIRPAEAKQYLWASVKVKVGNFFLLERINYRIVGLAAATVILIFFVKISFFNQGKYNLPMEMDEIESSSAEPQTKKIKEPLTEFKEEVFLNDDEKKLFEATTKQNGEQKGAGQKSFLKTADNRSGLKANKNIRPSTFQKTNRGIELSKSTAQTKKISGKNTQNEESKIVGEQEIAPSNLAVENENNRFDMAVQSKSIDIKNQNTEKVEKLGEIKTQQKEMAIQPPAVPAGSKVFTPAEKMKKTKPFEYQPTSIRENNSISKDDPFVNILKELNSKTKTEEKIKLLKTYLEDHPESVNKKQATYLLAKNLIQLAKDTKSDNRIKEALAFFYKNEILFKTFDDYKMIKKDIKKLE